MRCMNKHDLQAPRGADTGTGGNTPSLTTYFNGACPVCRTEVRHYQGVESRHKLGLGWHDVSLGAGALTAHGINNDQATRRLYAIDESGRLHAGVAAFIQVWQRLPGYRWLARLVSLPGVRTLAEWIYEGLLAPLLYRWNRWRHKKTGSIRRI